MSINQFVLVSQKNTYIAHRKFSENIEAEKVIDQGNLRSEIAQMHRLGLYLKNRDG